jgi:DNA-binding response OmpR family regulator
LPALARILVVEDEAHLADGLRYNLEAEGYEVDCVETGEAALELFDAGTLPDLVILDIMLPGMDGFPCCQGTAFAHGVRADPHADGARTQSGCT